MPRNTGLIGRGIALWIGRNNIALTTYLSGIGAIESESFFAVANVTNISLDGREADEIDFTHLLSDTFKEYRPGMVDPGTLTLSIDWNPADSTHDDETGLERLLTSGDTRNWKLDFTGAGLPKCLNGRGFIRSMSGVIPVGDKLTAEVTLRIDGATYWNGTRGSISPPGPTGWTVATGFWDDNGIWDDSAFWID